jgi:hypothetical protein
VDLPADAPMEAHAATARTPRGSPGRRPRPRASRRDDGPVEVGVDLDEVMLTSSSRGSSMRSSSSASTSRSSSPRRAVRGPLPRGGAGSGPVALAHSNHLRSSSARRPPGATR